MDVARGVLDTLILPHVNTDCMQVFLDEVARRHAGQRVFRPGGARPPVEAMRVFVDECSACRHQTTLLSGTLFEATKLPLSESSAPCKRATE